MFSVDILVTINLGAGKTVSVKLEVGGDKQKRQGYYVLKSERHHALPHIGPGHQHWHWSTDGLGAIVLENQHGRPWASLGSFPGFPTRTSSGIVRAFRLPIGPRGKESQGTFFGNWAVVAEARHRNLPLLDPEKSAWANAVAGCTLETGWLYDTSSGWSFTIGAGLGGSHLNGTLVLKRKEKQDVRRLRLSLKAHGIGVMSPTLGFSPSFESMLSGDLSGVRRTESGAHPFKTDDFPGGLCVIDGGVGLAVGRGKAGGGRSASLTTFLFLGGVASSGENASPTDVKAGLQTYSTAASAGKGQGPSAQEIVYLGTAAIESFR